MSIFLFLVNYIARSEVFCVMFRSIMREKIEGTVVIEDMRGTTMDHFLSFMYCGGFKDESWKNCIPSLVYAAEKV